jgi:hypothetical protein
MKKECEAVSGATYFDNAVKVFKKYGCFTREQCTHYEKWAASGTFESEAKNAGLKYTLDEVKNGCDGLYNIAID